MGTKQIRRFGDWRATRSVSGPEIGRPHRRGPSADCRQGAACSQPGMQILQQILAGDPYDIDARTTLAYGLLSSRTISFSTPTEALRSQHLDPGSADSYRFLGLLDHRQGRYTDAEINFRKALDKAPGNGCADLPSPPTAIDERNPNRVLEVVALCQKAESIDEKSAYPPYVLGRLAAASINYRGRRVLARD